MKLTLIHIVQVIKQLQINYFYFLYVFFQKLKTKTAQKLTSVFLHSVKFEISVHSVNTRRFQNI